MKKSLFYAAALLGGLSIGGAFSLPALGAAAQGQKRAAAAKPAAKQADNKNQQLSPAAAAEAKSDCVEGIKSLELRLISQYPAFSEAFVANYPRLSGDVVAACAIFTSYIVQKSGKAVNKDNIYANIWGRLKIQDSVPETLKTMETFRELMMDSQ